MTAIHLGSRKCALGEFKSSQNERLADGVEIIQKDVDVCVAWVRGKERAFGKVALNKINQNMNTTFRYMTRLIGVTDLDQIQKELLFMTENSIIVKEDGVGELVVKVDGRELTIEQVLGAFLRSIY